MQELLRNMRVIEGAAFIAAPSCGLHLAQLGAEVIRFDQIGGGPDFHRWPIAANGASLYWEGLNKGKKSIAIDLGTPQGRELAAALAAAPGSSAGLFVTNYPVESFLSFERLRARRADLICVRVMGWPDGAPAVDYTVNAATGLPLMTGPAGTEGPVNHVLPAWDLLCGSYAALALLAAERDRRTSGKGCELRVALSDIAASSLSHLGNVAEVLQGGDRARFGNELYGAFGRDFKLASGERVIVCAITRRQWRALVQALSLESSIAALEQRLGVSFDDDESMRFRYRAELYSIFEEAFAAQSRDTLSPILSAGGVTWAPYQSLRTAVTRDDRLFAQNPIFKSISHPSGLTYPAAGPVATMAGETPISPLRAPRLGEHTDEVLASVLGLSAPAIGALHDAGIVAGAGTRP